MGKDQATVLFRRKADGNVVGEVVDSSGKVVSSKEFGNFLMPGLIESYRLFRLRTLKSTYYLR